MLKIFDKEYSDKYNFMRFLSILWHLPSRELLYNVCLHELPTGGWPRQKGLQASQSLHAFFALFKRTVPPSPPKRGSSTWHTCCITLTHTFCQSFLYHFPHISILRISLYFSLPTQTLHSLLNFLPKGMATAKRPQLVLFPTCFLTQSQSGLSHPVWELCTTSKF